MDIQKQSAQPTSPTQVQQSEPQPVQQYPAPLPSSKPFFTNPIFLILAFILVAILASLGTYVVLQSKTSKPTPVATKPVISSPTPLPSKASATEGTSDPTANWKTYNNSVYSFKYPADSNWRFSEQNGSLGAIVSVLCSTCSNQVDYFQVVPVTTKSIDEYIKNPVGTSDFTNFKLAGADAVKAAYAGGPQAGGSSVKAFFVYKNQGYELDMRYGGLLNVNTLSKFPSPSPDILSTFKFAQ